MFYYCSSSARGIAVDRRRQLGNVSFGGDWSEAIVLREEIASAMAVLGRAVGDCIESDPRTPEAEAALALVCSRIARGPMLAAAWHRAAGLRAPGLRAAEMHRVLRIIASVADTASF